MVVGEELRVKSEELRVKRESVEVLFFSSRL